MSQRELPVGFGMALAQNERAMQSFASLPEGEKRALIERAHGARSRREMRALVDGLEKQGARPG